MNSAEMQLQNQKAFVVTKFWHLAIALVVYLLSLGAMYGTMRTRMEEAQRRMQMLEDRKVDQKQFDELRDDIIRRLDRIEAKVDRDRTIREIH